MPAPPSATLDPTKVGSTETESVSVRVREPVAPAPSPRPSMVPEPEPAPPGPDPLTALISQWQTEMATILKQTQEINAMRAKFARQFGTEMAEIGEEAKGLPKPGAPPTAPAPSPPPSKAIRPFAEGLPGDPPFKTVQNVLLALGTLAQGATGLMLKYPQGSLAALTGALTGWAEGDKLRGDREFETWKATVEEMSRAYEHRRQEWQDDMQKYGSNLEALKIRQGMRLQQEQARKEIVDAAMADVDAAHKFIDRQADLVAGIVQHKDKLALAREQMESRERVAGMHQLFREFQLKLTEAHRAIAEKARDRGLDLLAGTRAWNQYGKPLEDANLALKSYKQLDEIFRNLQSKGFLPEGPTTIEGAVAHFQRYLNRGDPDVLAMHALLNAVLIGRFDRATMGEIGFRAVSIIQDQMQALRAAGPYSSLKSVLDRMRSLTLQRAEPLFQGLANVGPMDPATSAAAAFLVQSFEMERELSPDLGALDEGRSLLGGQP